MKESRWDIPKPNFKKDLEFGKQGEDQVKGFLQGIVNGSFEVKSDRYRNGRMVVEVAQNPRKHGVERLRAGYNRSRMVGLCVHYE